MSAARIVTTTEKFDEMGKLVERTIKEEFQENETECFREKEKGREGDGIVNESERGRLRFFRVRGPYEIEPVPIERVALLIQDPGAITLKFIQN